ncbi:hypothetical protein ACFRCG_39780 [Embleya sp. NPDC056575]|uniref:hypothetical protein n=1 Tax=unclassified Embleya TaxID=2699296 RepID=UPI0036B9B1AA
MTTPADAVAAALARVEQVADPTARAIAAGELLTALADGQAQARALRQAAVLDLRARGYSHGDVAAAIGTSRSRAQQIAEGKTRTPAARPAAD